MLNVLLNETFLSILLSFKPKLPDNDKKNYFRKFFAVIVFKDHFGILLADKMQLWPGRYERGSKLKELNKC